MFSVVTRERKQLSGGLSRKHKAKGHPGPKQYTPVADSQALAAMLPALLEREFRGDTISILHEGWAWRPSALARHLGLCKEAS